LGSEIPYPAPELVATLSAVAEVGLPVLLVLGLGARYAALGLLGMTAIIQLTVPDGWANFHLPWAAMALAIMTFGPGKIALDYLLGLDWSLRAD
jgi:putative oxidoreductase